MSIFEAIGKTTFDVIRAFDGKPATWTPSNGGEVVNKDVLYQHPTRKADMNENDYTQEQHKVEYYETDFPGLFDSVQDANIERIQIEVSAGVVEKFVVKRVEKKGDGKTILAYITPTNL